MIGCLADCIHALLLSGRDEDKIFELCDIKDANINTNVIVILFAHWSPILSRPSAHVIAAL